MPIALLLGAIVMSVGTGLQTVLLPTRAALEGFSTFVIGLVGSAHNVGFVAGCVLVPMLVRRLGHVASFRVVAICAGAASLGYPFMHDASGWFLLRLTTGLCMAGLATVMESWVNAIATNDHRGRSLAVYSIAGAVAATTGQMLLPLADAHGALPFYAMAAALVLAAVPIGFSRAVPVAQSTPLSLKRLYALSPLGVVGCLFIGLANGAFWQLAPVYAQERSLSLTAIAAFMSIVVITGALAQWPLGKLSDRMDRRKVVVGALMAAIAADALMAAPAISPMMTLLAIAVFGACVLPIYWLCVAHTNDHLGRRHCVAASGGLLLVFGLGAVAGPLAASALMQQFGAGALFVYTGVIHIAFAIFALYRMRMRPRTGHALPVAAGLVHQG